MPSRPIRTFTVLPHLPERLEALQKLAYNMWWCWNHEASRCFAASTWKPGRLSITAPSSCSAPSIPAASNSSLHDDGFLAHMDRVEEAFDNYMTATTWYQETYAAPGSERQRAPSSDLRIAYFSAEFGIHESVPVYSGGLGVLAGDHLKSASDLGLPLVGVGLMYREGYFRQYLNVDGWQQERYPENDFFNLPLIPETNRDGAPLTIRMPFPGREVHVRIWRIQVGRVPLYLLDTNIPQNTPEDRIITARLYGGDNDMRIRQEMVLGIGGVLALRALGKPPTVCHMNEGHSAFCGLERIRTLMEESNLPFHAAREAVAAGTVFTTHTPVPAGNDVFAPQLIEHYLGSYLGQFKIDRNEFLGLGRQNPLRSKRAVLHDRAGHSPGQRHQRRQQAARQRLAQDVEEHLAGTARHRGADHVDHQRRPHA